MKEFSVKWISSKQTRKQRKYRYNAPMHIRRKMVSGHLSKTLRKEYGKRSIMLRKDDEVKIVRGGFAGTTGKISKIDLKALKVYVDTAKRKKVSGQEVEAAIDPSNILVMNLNMDDKRRRKFIARKASNVKTKAEKK
jgi:large subunit ribosomal protein L24